VQARLRKTERWKLLISPATTSMLQTSSSFNLMSFKKEKKEKKEKKGANPFQRRP
jgi:hypothetical protein